MTTLIDFIMDLFRNPAAAAAYVADPEGALRDAGLPNVSAAQLASVAATAAPAGLALGNGDPVYGLQRAVADYHSIASPFSPQTAFTSQPTFAPQTDTSLMSGNSTDLASHNSVPIMSPNQDAGANAQQGAFNLGFGDITLGNKETTTNTATDGAVVNTGHSSGPIVTGDGAVLGHGNSVQNGDVLAGANSHVAVGQGNAIEDSSQHAGGQLITDNQGPVISGNDMGGGHGGGASAGGASAGGSGGGLLNIGGSGGHANAGDGGSAGSIIVTSSDTHSVGGNQSTAGHDLGSGNTSALDSSVHSSTSANTSLSDQSVHDSSVHSTSSVQSDSSVHSSVTDDSVHQVGGLHTNTSTTTDVASHNTVDPHAGFHGF